MSNIAFGLVMIADLVTFVLIVPAVGIAQEANPLMRALYEIGIPAMAVVKASAFVAILLLTRRLGERRRTGVIVATAITLVGVVGNVASWIVA